MSICQSRILEDRLQWRRLSRRSQREALLDTRDVFLSVAIESSSVPLLPSLRRIRVIEWKHLSHRHLYQDEPRHIASTGSSDVTKKLMQ